MGERGGAVLVLAGDSVNGADHGGWDDPGLKAHRFASLFPRPEGRGFYRRRALRDRFAQGLKHGFLGGAFAARLKSLRETRVAREKPSLSG